MPGYPCCCDDGGGGVDPVTCATACSGAGGSTAPGQVIVTLPSIANSEPTTFNHAGGDFLLDFYGEAAFGPNTRALGAPIGGNATPQIDLGFTNSHCGYMGASIGTHCGKEVRPFGVYCARVIGVSSNGIVIGYALADTTVSPSKWRQFTVSLFAGEQTAWVLDLASGTSCARSGACLTTNFTASEAGSTGVPSECDEVTTATGESFTIGACTLSMRPA